jgi:hypothetical protein
MDNAITNRPKKLDMPVCCACGAEAMRAFAGYCRICGKDLREGYRPLDSLRSSYGLQGVVLTEQREQPIVSSEELFPADKNNAAEIARAFLVYSLVPYLGLIFVPGAIVFGCVGLYLAKTRPWNGGARTSGYTIVLAFTVTGSQIVLWWLLYLIPTLGRQF